MISLAHRLASCVIAWGCVPHLVRDCHRRDPDVRVYVFVCACSAHMKSITLLALVALAVAFSPTSGKMYDLYLVRACRTECAPSPLAHECVYLCMCLWQVPHSHCDVGTCRGNTCSEASNLVELWLPVPPPPVSRRLAVHIRDVLLQWHPWHRCAPVPGGKHS